MSAFLVRHYGFSIPGFGIVFIIAVILFIGFLSSHFIGRRLIPFMEKQINRIPFVEKIYPSAKQLSDFLFKPEKKEMFKKVLLIEYPGPDSYALGFITIQRKKKAFCR